MASTRPIVIIGGGIAGLRAALELDRIYSGQLDVPIFLIDAAANHVYTPSLYATIAQEQPRFVSIPYSRITQNTNIRFIHERVTHVDPDAQLVTTEHHHYAYHDLIIAIGGQNRHFEVKQQRAKDDAIFLSHTMSDILEIRDWIEARVDEASRQHKPVGYGHITIVGGGLSGVECAVGLQEYSAACCKRHNLPATTLHLTLMEAGAHILPELPASARQKVVSYLRKIGISIATKSTMTPRGAQTIMKRRSHGPVKSVVWTSGHIPHKLAQNIPGLRHDKLGRVIVDSNFRAIDQPSIWAIGDAAAVIDSGRAETAVQHGRHVAYAIRRTRANNPPLGYAPGDPPLAVRLSSTYGVGWFGNQVLEGIAVIWYKNFQTLVYLCSILPFPEAFNYWWNGGETIDPWQPLNDDSAQLSNSPHKPS